MRSPAHTSHVEGFILEQGCSNGENESKDFIAAAKDLAKSTGKTIAICASDLMLANEGFFHVFSGYTESERFECINFLFEINGINERI